MTEALETKQPETYHGPLKVNLNRDVMVRLNEAGEQAWANFWANTGSVPSIERDEQGYTRMQLHRVMQIFGPAISGDFGGSPIETDIIVLPEPTFEEVLATGRLAAELTIDSSEVPHLR